MATRDHNAGASQFAELNDDQRRQYIDAESLFQHLEKAQEEAWRHRGSMFWREQSGKTYLIKLFADSRQRSLGPESEATRRTFETFMERKKVVEARLKSLRERVGVMRRLNRALRVGRTPDLLVDVLNELAKARVAHHFLVVGTNALFAYETAAGIRFPSNVMETEDADILYDTRRRASFLQVMSEEGLSFMDLLRKVDKTFERDPNNHCTAVNDKGYQIDLIRRFPPAQLEDQEHPLQITPHEDDLWVVRASTGQRLLSVPRFSQVVVGLNGAMARMTTVHPMAFARIKRQLGHSAQRERHKAPKDLQQAKLVEAMVREYLPQLAMEPVAQTDDDTAAPLETPVSHADGSGSSGGAAAAAKTTRRRGRPRKDSPE